MANEQPKVQYTLEGIAKNLELLKQNSAVVTNNPAEGENIPSDIVSNNQNEENIPGDIDADVQVEESIPSDKENDQLDFEEEVIENPTNTIIVPRFEELIADDEDFIEVPIEPIEVPKFKKMTTGTYSKEDELDKIPKVKSEKARLVTVPKLIINDIKMFINQKRINRKLNLGKRPKITSALAHLVVLPVGLIVLAKEAIKEKIEATQFKYGAWYYNEYLVNKEEKEREKNIKLADKLEQKRIDKEYNEAHKENLSAVIDSLNEADKQKIIAQKEKYKKLKSMHL